MFLLCKNVKIVLRECSVGPKSAKIRFLRQSQTKYMAKMLNISRRTNTTSERKPLLTNFRLEASLSDLSFGLGRDLRLRILGLMVEWSGEQPSSHFPSETSVFRMCRPFRSKSSTFRVLGKHVFLLILLHLATILCPALSKFFTLPAFNYTTASKKELNVFFWKSFWFSSI